MVQACSKSSTAPFSACIDALPSTVSVGATLTFQSCTSGATTYTWSFGDGGTATGDSVLYIYTNPGTYTGSLTVSNGSTNSVQKFTITVVPTSWTFRGVTYSIDSVVGSRLNLSLTATGTNAGSTANLTFKFYPYPNISGGYYVINGLGGPTAPYQAAVTFSTDSAGIEKIYVSTGGGPVAAALTVSGGKISLILPTIEMMNVSNNADSTALSASIAQTQ